MTERVSAGNSPGAMKTNPSNASVESQGKGGRRSPQPRAIRGALPNALDAVRVESGVVRDDGQPFALCLRDQHAVEGVLVWSGQLAGPTPML